MLNDAKIRLKCLSFAMTMIVVKAFIIIFLSLAFLIGLGLGRLIIRYLGKKPQVLKTAFDLVLIDSIMFSLIFGFTIYAMAILYIGFEPLPFLFVSIFVVFQYLIYHLTLISWSLTMLIKYLYIFHGYLMFDYPDSYIRKVVNLTKIAILVPFVVLDFYSPLIQNNPVSFDWLLSQEKFVR